MKKLLLSSLMLATFSQGVLAQCVPAAKTEYLALSAATGLDKKVIVKELMNKYCYNFSEFQAQRITAPFFYAPDKEMLKIFVDAKIDVAKYIRPVTEMDLLSHLLVRPFITPVMPAADKKALVELLNKYQANVTIKDFDSQAQTLNSVKSNSKDNNYNELITYTANLTAPSYTYTMSRDKLWKNTVLHYAVHMSNPTVLEILLKEKYLQDAMFKRNNYGVAPIHLAFLDRPSAPAEAKTKVNKMILDLIDKNAANRLFINNMQFTDFVEMNASHNEELRQNLSKKLNYKVDAQKIDLMRKSNKATAIYNFTERLKKLESED